MKKRKKKSHKKECDDHPCKNKGKLYKCKYCKREFCFKHRKPKPAGLPRFKGTSPEDLKFMREFHKKGRHPCIPYNKYWEDKRKREAKRYEIALNKLLSTNKKKHYEEEFDEDFEELKEPIKKEHHHKERISREPIKHFKKKKLIKWAIISFLIIGVAYIWNQGYIEDYLAGDKKFGGIIDNSLESKEMSSLVLSKINDARKESSVNELIYNKNAYNLAVAISKKFYKTNSYTINNLELEELSEIYELNNIQILSKKLESLEKSEFKLMILEWTSREIFAEKTLNQNFTDGAIGCYKEVCIFVLSIEFKPIISERNNFIEKVTNEVADTLTHNVDISLIELEINTLINGERTQRGLSILGLEGSVSDVARIHSQDMINNNFFDHINLKGESPTIRGAKSGVTCYKDYGSYYTEGFAENLGGTPFGDVIGCGYVYSEKSIAKCMVDGWMESPGHRANILTPDYDETGIGVACDYSECMGTQMFC